MGVVASVEKADKQYICYVYDELGATRKMTKFTIIIILVFANYYALAQKTLKDFDGTLIFKESTFYYPITRTIKDTAIIFSSYEVGKMVTIEEVVPAGIYDTHENNFLPIKFYKKSDTLFYKYSDPYDIDHDTTFCKLFPLSFKDSISSVFCFKITMDTIRGTDSNRTITIHTECEGDNLDIKTYRTKDTTVVLKEYKLDCYTFEQKSIIGSSKDVFFTRIIIVDKNTLIPIDVKEYNFHTSKRVHYRNVHQGKNLLTFHQKLIGIE